MLHWFVYFHGVGLVVCVIIIMQNTDTTGEKQPKKTWRVMSSNKYLLWKNDDKWNDTDIF
jgi:hypothetical protein